MIRLNSKNFKNFFYKHGIYEGWNKILKNYSNLDTDIDFSLKNLPNLYEISLALMDKNLKKANGIYYTPEDVADVMSQWLEDQPETKVCDVGCGCGNLILRYFYNIGKTKTRKLIKNGNVFLFDLDKTALLIARFLICEIYGNDLIEHIHIISGDFLSEKISLPNNCKVISNPPYGRLNCLDTKRNTTLIQHETKELYAAFMEKILLQSNSSVIITPYSFTSGNKYYHLRRLMNNYSGYIVSFDNVPGNIFNGKKHGIFNSNTSNSVRASITVTQNSNKSKGYKCTPLIRFKNSERDKLLNADVLINFLGHKAQIIDEMHTKYAKCYCQLENLWEKWNTASNCSLEDLVDRDGTYNLYVPTTCRYFTVASKKKLNRTGMINLTFSDKNKYNYAYCMLNSSFCYWYWRLFDGGINYPISLLTSIPVFYNKLNKSEIKKCNKLAEEMQNIENDSFVYKKNAGKYQENIKFDTKYRIELNSLFCSIIGSKMQMDNLLKIHENNISSVI